MNTTTFGNANVQNPNPTFGNPPQQQSAGFGQPQGVQPEQPQIQSTGNPTLDLALNSLANSEASAVINFDAEPHTVVQCKVLEAPYTRPPSNLSTTKRPRPSIKCAIADMNGQVLESEIVVPLSTLSRLKRDANGNVTGQKRLNKSDLAKGREFLLSLTVGNIVTGVVSDEIGDSGIQIVNFVVE